MARSCSVSECSDVFSLCQVVFKADMLSLVFRDISVSPMWCYIVDITTGELCHSSCCCLWGHYSPSQSVSWLVVHVDLI